MTEHHWSEPMPWQQEQHDRQVRKMLREAEIPVPPEDDTDMTGAPVAWAVGVILIGFGFLLGLTAATFFGG
jgi:hypothetical protein